MYPKDTKPHTNKVEIQYIIIKKRFYGKLKYRYSFLTGSMISEHLGLP